MASYVQGYVENARQVRNAPSDDRENIIVAGGAGKDSVEMFNWRQRTYTVKTLSRMPEPRHDHCTEIFDDCLLIFGGRTTFTCRDNLSSVVLYDIKNNVCKQLAPLPYEVCMMATVRWGDNVVVIGGIDKHCKALNTVIMYNVKTEQSHMLPPMRCKRSGCAAVVVENNIVVLGGYCQQGILKSVESFNFERYTWEELPEMSQVRHSHTAVVV